LIGFVFAERREGKSQHEYCGGSAWSSNTRMTRETAPGEHMYSRLI
jgi:hypothetical protein